MARKFFPRTAEELIQYMEKRFPEPYFDEKTHPDEMRFKAGMRYVVRAMRDEFDLATRRKDL